MACSQIVWTLLLDVHLFLAPIHVIFNGAAHLIANVFYRAGIIEQWSTGVLKVVDWCRDNAKPAPIGEEQSGSVVVFFRPAAGFKGG